MKSSELLWTDVDYQAAGQDVPDRVAATPGLSEGDLMSADEVEEFIKDSIATLRILADKASPRFDDVLEYYLADMAALLQLGRMSEDEYNELTDPANLRF